jgi:hypothetical protein
MTEVQTLEDKLGQVLGKGPKGKKETVARRSKFEKLYPEDATLELLVKENPKKEGSAARGVFEHYIGSATVAEYLAKGGTYQSIAYDVGRQFIKVTPR